MRKRRSPLYLTEVQELQRARRKGGIQIHWPRPSGDRSPPTVDDSPLEVRGPREYPDEPEGTFVISGPLIRGVQRSSGPGRPFTVADARAWVLATYGEILRTYPVVGRWAFRVWKPTHPRGRYTPPREE